MVIIIPGKKNDNIGIWLVFISCKVFRIHSNEMSNKKNFETV